MVLAELHEERDHVDEAMLVLSRLAVGAPRRCGLPPKWMTDQNSRGPKRRGRPSWRKGMSAANRKAQSERYEKILGRPPKEKIHLAAVLGHPIAAQPIAGCATAQTS